MLLSGCVRERVGDRPAMHLTRPMMGTLVEVLWREGGDTPRAADKVRAAMDRMAFLATGMNLFDADSELSRINAAAGEAPVRVSPEILEVIRAAVKFSAMTGGAFDATVGPVEAVWGDIQRGGSAGRFPDDRTIRQALGKVGVAGVRLDTAAGTVFLQKKGSRLDLGGIAKGYIIDRGVRDLREQGLDCVMINAGGDIRASGCDEAPPWRVGLQDPFRKDRLLGVFHVRDGAVVTSGSYERYVETDQGRFSHILDPRTGHPARGPVSVTVAAPRAAMADALATAFMVTGRQEAMGLIRGLGSVQAVFVEADGSVWIDERLRERFHPGVFPPETILRYYVGGKGREKNR